MKLISYKQEMGTWKGFVSGRTPQGPAGFQKYKCIFSIPGCQFLFIIPPFSGL